MVHARLASLLLAQQHPPPLLHQVHQVVVSKALAAPIEREGPRPVAMPPSPGGPSSPPMPSTPPPSRRLQSAQQDIVALVVGVSGVIRRRRCWRA